ncbi:MAG TPA: PucR family transcriptional regulator ligand-binding domain-containing protein [Pseudonocardia sp.]|nr:PucR family transcriptional regulator ligand-binding domain-containing protein [Pseudonocardia sp.]
MVTVAELVADPELRLQLVGGRPGVDREIEAAAVSELTDPGPWLQGGELLLTIGLLLPATPDGCRSYLTRLDAAGVRAVGLGLGADLPHQGAPAQLVAAADEVGMPLLTVPDPVPFIAVTKAVFAHRARAERKQLEWALQTQRALTAAAVSPGGLLGILAAHRRATGRTGVVIDLLGRVLAESDPGGDRLVERLAELLDSVRAQGLAAAAVDIADGRRRELHPLGARRLRAWLLVDGPAELPVAHQLSGDLVSLLSLELERRHGLDAAQRRSRVQVLDRLARATVDDTQAARWLGSVGLADVELRAAAVAAPTEADELAADLLITLPDALVRVVGDVVEVAVPLDADLPRVLATLAPGRPTGIGIGVRPGALAVSLRQAHSALPASRVQGRHVHAEEIASSRLLLSAVGPAVLQAYADAVLGPLDASDRAGDLLRALTAFLEHSGHWGAAAAALRLHRHTMRNRIDVVQRLTGRRLDSAQDCHELWLALRARETAP